MRKRYFIYILAVVVAFSYIIATPSSVYARMGMPDVNVAGLNDDGSTIVEEKAQQERAKKKAEAEAPAPISAQNQNTQANQNTPANQAKQPNAVTNFQNNPNIPKDPGQQNIGMLNRDKDNSPVDLRDQAGMNQNYTEPSKEQIQQAVAVCIDTLKEDGIDENKAKTACASPVGRQYAFCLVNVEEGKLGTISKDDCFQTMRQEAILFQDDSNNSKDKGFWASLKESFGNIADGAENVLSSIKDGISEWWNDPDKLGSFMKHVKEHPFETAANVALIIAAIAGSLPSRGASLTAVIPLAASLTGRQAFSFAVKEAVLNMGKTLSLTSPTGMLRLFIHPKQLMSAVGGTFSKFNDVAAKFLTDTITGAGKRVKWVNQVGKARYGDAWKEGSSLEDLKKIAIETGHESSLESSYAQLRAKDFLVKGEQDMSKFEGYYNAYQKTRKWLPRGEGAAALMGTYDISDSKITSQARIEDENYDMNAPVSEKMEEARNKRSTKANIIQDAYKEHVSSNYGAVQQEVMRNLNVAKTHQDPTAAINKAFEEKYGFNCYSEIGTISELQARAEGQEAEKKDKPIIK